MADLLKELVSGVVDAALKEVLKKTGVRKTATKRTRRKATTRKKASGGILGDIIEAALKPAKKPPPTACEVQLMTAPITAGMKPATRLPTPLTTP